MISQKSVWKDDNQEELVHSTSTHNSISELTGYVRERVENELKFLQSSHQGLFEKNQVGLKADYGLFERKCLQEFPEQISEF